MSKLSLKQMVQGDGLIGFLFTSDTCKPCEKLKNLLQSVDSSILNIISIDVKKNRDLNAQYPLPTPSIIFYNNYRRILKTIEYEGIKIVKKGIMTGYYNIGVSEYVKIISKLLNN